MGFGKPPGVPCPPNNPHCQGLEPIGASIENWILSTIIIILITIYIYYKMKTELAQSAKLSIESMIAFRKAVESIDNRSTFEKFYDKVSTFLFGEKSFKWGELKGL